MNTNQRVTIDQLVFKSLYYRYRAFIIPVATIFVCVLLFWFVVLAQMESFFAQKDALAVDTQKVSVMRQNLSLLTSLDDVKLNQLLTTATSALPAEKDFAGIVNSLQNAAAVSGSLLGDYSFSLGDLTGLDQKGKATAQLPVQLNVTLKGDLLSAQRFAAQLKKQLPLSDSIAIAVNANESITVTVVFYYAAIPKIVFQDGNPLPILGQADQTLLTTLASGNDLQNATISSSSATIIPSVTPTPIKSGPTVTVSPSPIVSLSPTPSVTVAPTSSASGSAQ